MLNFKGALMAWFRVVLVVAGSLLVPSAAMAQSLSVSPSSVNFGSQPSGVAGNPWTLTLNNTSGTAVTLGTISVSDATDFFDTTTCGATLGAYSTCNIAVGFSPAAAGNYSGSLLFVNGATAQPIAVALNGTGMGSGTASAPNPSLAPSSINFNTQTVGTSSNAWTATLNNSGAGALDVTSLTVSDPADFSITTDCGSVVSAYQTCHVLMTFTPSTAGAITGKITLLSNAATQTIALNGTGVSAGNSVVVSPSAVSFGNQATGLASNAQTLTVSNTGAASVSLSAFGFSAASGFSVNGTTCGATLAAYSTCNVSMIFTPGAAGAASANFQFSANGTAESVPVSGTGVASTPTLLLSPSTVDFGTATAGQPGPVWTISVNNTSSVAATFAQGFSISGSTAFVIQSNNCGSVLAANGSCNVQVAFNPTAGGTYNGSLNVLVAGAKSAQTVTLLGNATASTPTVTVAPSAVNFGSVTTGQTANSWTLTVNNPGSTPISFSSPVALAGSREFEMTTTCGAGLAAYSQCQVLVSFFPVIPGTMTGQVIVNVVGGASGATQTVSLTGTGVGPALTPTVTLTPTVYDFGLVVIGTTSTVETFTVTNAGKTDAYFASPTSLTGSSTFAISSNNCANPIPAGTSCTIGVTFAPTAAVTSTGELVLPFDGITNPLVSGLNGTGQVPRLVLTTTALQFGNQSIGSTSVVSFFTLTNPTATTAIAYTLTVPASYNVIDVCGGIVPAGSTCKVFVSFTPEVLAFVSGTITVNETTGGYTDTVSLNGAGTGVNFAPGALTFPAQSVGVASTPLPEQINIVGAGVPAITSIAVVGADFALSGNCAPQLSLGLTCSQGVVFNPTATGARTGSVVVSYVGGASQSFGLTGTGTAPVSSLVTNVTSLNFGDISQTGYYQVQFVTITNRGTGMAQFSVNSSDWDFYTYVECPGAYSGVAEFSLQPGQSCQVEVVFEPINLGIDQGTLVIANADGTAANVSMTGQYTAQQGVYNWSASPAAMAFATTPVGTATAPQTLTLTNKSSSPQYLYYGIYSPSAAQAFQIVGGSCGQYNYVAPGGTCTLQVIFAPQQYGTAEQPLYFYSSNNYQGFYDNVELVGNGSINPNAAPSYTLNVAPGMLTLSAGSTGTATFTMTPQVGFKGSVTLACDGLPVGVTCSFAPPTLTSDGSGQQLTSVLTVTSTPSLGQAHSSKLASLLVLPVLALIGLCFGSKRRKLGIVTLGLFALMSAMVTSTTGCGAGLDPNSAKVGATIISILSKSTVNGTTDTKVATFKLTITN